MVGFGNPYPGNPLLHRILSHHPGQSSGRVNSICNLRPHHLPLGSPSRQALHFPAGAVPKDGPSAGITIASAMYSQFTGKRMSPKFAMTGEITLTGEVLAVGGVREKVLAAKRHGIRTVILPADNERDVLLLDPAWTRGLRFLYVATFADVLATCFGIKKKS